MDAGESLNRYWIYSNEFIPRQALNWNLGAQGHFPCIKDGSTSCKNLQKMSGLVQVKSWDNNFKLLKNCPSLAQNKTSETDVAPQALSGWTDGANYFHLDLNRIRTLARQFALCICLYYLEKKARLYEQEGRIGQCQQQITQDISSSSTTLPPACLYCNCTQ